METEEAGEDPATHLQADALSTRRIRIRAYTCDFPPVACPDTRYIRNSEMTGPRSEKSDFGKHIRRTRQVVLQLSGAYFLVGFACAAALLFLALRSLFGLLSLLLCQPMLRDLMRAIT